MGSEQFDPKYFGLYLIEALKDPHGDWSRRHQKQSVNWD